VRLRFAPATAALLAACLPLSAQYVLPEPVDALRQALNRPYVEPIDAKDRPAAMKERQAMLQERANALRGVNQLRQALGLTQEWEGDHTEAGELVRKEIGKRLEDTLRGILKTGDATSKLAVVSLIGDMGTLIRGTDPADGASYSRRFTQDLAALTAPGNDRILREAAARALGKILPDSKIANDALGKLLEDPDAGLRRAAAAGIMDELTSAVGRRNRNDTAAQTVTLPRDERIALGVSTAALAGKFANDADADVQRACLEALLFVSETFTDYLSGKLGEPNLGKVGDDPNKLRQGFDDRAALVPLARQLADVLPNIVTALKTENRTNRILAARVLEVIGLTRKGMVAPLNEQARWRFPGDKLPNADEIVRAEPPKKPVVEIAPKPTDVPAENDPLRKALTEALPALAAALGDREVRVRLFVINAIDAVGADATPIAAELARATGDQNAFVRWVAARIIGKFAPNKPEIGVAALAGLANDPDIDVRRAALTSIDKYGAKYAQAAGPAVARSASRGDADLRLMALRTLTTIKVPAETAIEPLLGNLKSDDPRVRRSTADAIGSYGAAAKTAVATLKQLMQDDYDADVRRAASEAVLNIESGL
jgi:hypothetical protein